MKYNLLGFIGVCLVSLVACNNNDNVQTTTSADTLVTNTETKTTDMEKAKINGPAGTLFVDDGGSGGIPILFVHSFGGDTHQWDNQLAYFRKERRAIAMDMRGHGQSDAPFGNQYDIKEEAKDIEAVVDSLHLTRFVLVGHSMGGAASIAYASEHPELVTGLVLTGTPGRVPKEQAKSVMASLEADSSYQKIMDGYMEKLLTNAKPDVVAQVNKGVNKLSKDASVSLIRANFEFDPVPALKKYKGPVLLISADGDNQPGSLHQLFPAIPQVIIPGTSHWVQLDKPAEFNKTLNEFLKKIN